MVTANCSTSAFNSSHGIQVLQTLTNVPIGVRPAVFFPMVTVGTLLTIMTLKRPALKKLSISPYLLTISILDWLYLATQAYISICRILDKGVTSVGCSITAYIFFVTSHSSDTIVAIITVQRALMVAHSDKLKQNKHSNMKKMWFQVKNCPGIGAGIVHMRITNCQPKPAGSD